MGALYMLLKLSVVVALVSVGVRFFWFGKRLPPVTEGFFLPQYRPVAELFRKYVEDGTERGGSFAVYHRGERLVDLWGGYADPDIKRPWREDTVTIVWSTTKGASAVAVAKLVERGLLDYKAEIRKYWPEFEQNGKRNITLDMLLSHQAGLGTMGQKTLTLHDYKHDWPKVEQLMASAAPDFPPGSQVMYQAFTYAMYLDALVRRVDPQHRNLSQFFKDEIAAPYGIDFQIGLPRQQYYRAARSYQYHPLSILPLFLDPVNRPVMMAYMLQPDSALAKTTRVFPFFGTEYEILNDPVYAEVGIGSFLGFGSARSVAKMYDMLANGGRTGDKALLPKSLAETLGVPLTIGISRTVKRPDSEFARGFQTTKNHKGDSMFGHDGFGGQQGMADVKNKLGISYVTNFLWANGITPPAHYMELERVFYECFDKQQGKT